MHTFLKTIAGILIAPLVGIMGFAGYNLNPQAPVASPSALVQTTAPAQSFGSTNAIETPVALFSTSLQSQITSSATTMTLQNATTLDGTTLASSTYSFIIDEGQANQEFVKADCTGTACTNMDRGLSAISGTTTIASLAQTHRRGASVKITDAPLLLNLTRIVNGISTFPNIVSYTTHPTFVSQTSLIDKKYVDDTAFSGAGVVNATSGARGIVQIATGLQLASSTGICSSTAPCVLSADNATSTFNAATAALKVVVTGNSGQIDANFFATSTGLFKNMTLTGTTTVTATSSLTVGAFPAYNIGKNIQVFTSSGTFIPPSGVNVVKVEVIGGGGGGGGSTGSPGAGGGGGGGGYALKYQDVTATSSVKITVGAGGSGQLNGNGNPGGTSSFSTFVSASGGSGGIDGGQGSAGGVGTSGDLNIQGGGGTNAITTISGAGGSSFYGGGGLGAAAGNNNGAAGGNYGGGGGGSSSSGATATGGAGGTGVVIITW